MDRYTARINLHGTTQRERAKNRLIANIQDKAKDNPSYKLVKLNGVETHLIIDSGTQTYYKEFKSLPDQEINIGDYVDFANSKWIVATCDYDDEIYRDGKLYQCNYLLKWQNELGEIIERWAVILSASKYNDGTDGGKIITLGSDQLSVMIPLDKESLKLKKSMGKKFFIDYNTEDPTAYELTGTGNVPDTYNGHGVTSWIVKECAYTASEDDLKYGVCNYKAIDSPTPPADNNETDVSIHAIIQGNKTLKCGFPRSYTAVLSDIDGNTMDWDNTLYSWNVVSNFSIDRKINENKIELYSDDEDVISSSFLLQVINLDGNFAIAEIEITVVDIV